MKIETLNLEQEVISLTSQFSQSLVDSMTALNSGPLTEETSTLVSATERLAGRYEHSLEKMLLALEGEPLADERVHRVEFAIRMKNLLEREMKILLGHPTLRPQQ